MEMLTLRSYAGESDLHPIVDLLNACEAIDQLDNFYSVTALRLEFAEPGFDPAHDLRVWENSRGELVAIGQMWIPAESEGIIDGFLWFNVHPTARNRQLELEVIAWGKSRLQTVAQTRGLPARLQCSARDTQLDRIRLFEQHGFTYERCFLTMERSLLQPIPQPQLPEGFVLIDQQQGLSTAAWVDLHNHSFIDHWNFHPVRVEQCDHWRSDPNYRPDLDLVAIAPDGTYAAFCYCSIDDDENQSKARQEGWISILGTRRGFRRMGLGRAMLLSGLQRLQDAGMTIAKLGVDTENPNCAQRLYESVGFCKCFARLTYALDL